ncbi:MAG: hypothetical protein PHR00_04655, partial [Patescibacteria group bacterium]|nr:hypothetical protein [Patescibacteria group bacterium]
GFELAECVFFATTVLMFVFTFCYAVKINKNKLKAWVWMCVLFILGCLILFYDFKDLMKSLTCYGKSCGFESVSVYFYNLIIYNGSLMYLIIKTKKKWLKIITIVFAGLLFGYIWF